MSLWKIFNTDNRLGSMDAHYFFTTVLMSVWVEYVTDMKRTHTIGEGQFLSCVLPSFTSLPLPCSLSFPFQLSRSFSGMKENLVVIFINNYQKSIRPHVNTVQLPCILCERRHVNQQRLLSDAAPTQHTVCISVSSL